MKVLKFNEVNINLNELERELPNKGIKRGDVLVSKIEKEEELRINKNGDVKDVVVVNKEEVIDNITGDNGEYDSAKAKDYFLKQNSKRYKEDAIKGDDGNRYKLNDIEKTSDFGSNRGSGLGTIDTRYVESIQCLFFAYRQRKGAPLEDSDVHKLINSPDRIFNRLIDSIDVGNTILNKEIVSKFENKWTSTFFRVANIIYDPSISNSEFSSDLLIDPNKRYKFYQISSKNGVVGVIKEKFSSLEKVSLSKWNPSDVWAVDTTSENKIIQDIKDCKSLSHLNDIINLYFDERKLIGISLKKVSEKEAKLIINKITSIPRYKFESVRVSESSLSTIGLYISASSSSEFGESLEYMQIRSSSGPDKIQNICGEVKGKTARHGKISLTKINKILKSYDVETVISATSEDYYSENLSEWTDEELKEEIEAINDMIIRKYGNISNPSRQKPKKITRARLISKYQSLLLAWILMENQNKMVNKHFSKSDKIIGNMFQYALSINLTGDKSGRTPKYARFVD